MPRAADGDGVDVFIGPDHDSDLVVVIDQYKGKTFDESKFCIGIKTREQGERLYLSNYPRGWKLGPVSTTTVQQLKEWLKSGDTKSPFKGQMVKAAAEDYAKLLHNLRLRRECPRCGTPDQDPYPPCDCGQEKSAFVQQDAETGKWILWTRDKKRKLGTHDTAEEAYKQEYAIMKSQERTKEAAAAEQLKVDRLRDLIPRVGRLLSITFSGVGKTTKTSNDDSHAISHEESQQR